MKVLLILLVVAGLALWPFVALRQRWALRLWVRFKLVFIVYALVIFLAALISLVFRWDQIYG